MSERMTKAIEALVPAEDHREKEGYFTKLSAAGLVTAIVSATATIPYGVILEGENTDGQDSIGICGGNVGPVDVKLAGTVAKGDYGQLEADGRVIKDSGAGARVIVCLFKEAGVANELVQAILLTPVVYA